MSGCQIQSKRIRIKKSVQCVADFNQRILDIEAELRKQSRERVKKASMFL